MLETGALSIQRSVFIWFEYVGFTENYPMLHAGKSNKIKCALLYFEGHLKYPACPNQVVKLLDLKCFDADIFLSQIT